MTTESERFLLAYMVFVLLVITALVVLFFVVFQKRKNKLFMERIRREQEFKEQLATSEIEIHEQTLKNVGQELHDNVGQMLSLAGMQLSMINNQVPETVKNNLTEVKVTVNNSLAQIRALTKSLNGEVIANHGFQKSIESEMDRLNKLEILNAELLVEGNPGTFDHAQDSIILFRVVQEFISNTLKYADAKHLKVMLCYGETALKITATDDGKGFDMNNVEMGSGLINIKSRAKLLNTSIELRSLPKKGTKLVLEYPYR